MSNILDVAWVIGYILMFPDWDLYFPVNGMNVLNHRRPDTFTSYDMADMWPIQPRVNHCHPVECGKLS